MAPGRQNQLPGFVQDALLVRRCCEPEEDISPQFLFDYMRQE